MDSAPRPGALAPGIFLVAERNSYYDRRQNNMIYSAGTIIIDSNPDLTEPHVLVVRAYANWDFPKGHVEQGETLMTAAVRETLEETTLEWGVDYDMSGLQSPSVSYGSGKRRKTATYFLADRTSDKDPFLPFSEEIGKPENDEWRWVPASVLPELLPQRLQSVACYVVTWLARN
jgi:8-oxo-dGTP pyrophosphatase MutT (NUDIX family)|tara:strand:- start:955 stop:1476 length:522 start_codon:yes stop_codon:yes gene_type:complete